MERRTIWIVGIVALMLAAVLASIFSDSPGEADSDGDDLSDAEERSGWIINIDLVGKRIVRHVTSDTNNPDTDGDGLDDAVELLNGLDPRDPDTDDDGLTDCQEQLHTVIEECGDPAFADVFDGGYGTDPSNADSDRGPSRYLLNVVGYIDESYTLNPRQVTWGDGISDGDELTPREITLHGGRVVTITTDPLLVDTDGDGLEDGEELFVFKSNPRVADTDGDGCKDGNDAIPRFEERFYFGFDTIHLTKSPSGRNSVDLVLEGILGNGLFSHGGQGIRIPVGQEVNISELDLPVPSTGCYLSPNNAWDRIQFIAFDNSGSKPVDLDLSTHSLDFTSYVGDTPTLWWELRLNQFGVSSEGPYVDAPMTWTGEHGTIQFSPASSLHDPLAPC